MQVRARRLRTNGDGDISGLIRGTRRACARLCPHFAGFEPFRGEPGVGWEAPRSRVPRISPKSIGMTLGWFVRDPSLRLMPPRAF